MTYHATARCPFDGKTVAFTEDGVGMSWQSRGDTRYNGDWTLDGAVEDGLPVHMWPACPRCAHRWPVAAVARRLQRQVSAGGGSFKLDKGSADTL